MINKSFTVVSDGRDLKSLMNSFEQKGRVIEIHLNEDLNTKNIAAQIKTTKNKTYHLVGITGDEFAREEFAEEGRRFNLSRVEIMREARRRGYRRPPAEAAFLLREKFTQQELGYRYIEIMHKPITKCEPALNLVHQMTLVVDRYDGLEFLTCSYGNPFYLVNKYDFFVFLAP